MIQSSSASISRLAEHMRTSPPLAHRGIRRAAPNSPNNTMHHGVDQEPGDSARHVVRHGCSRFLHMGRAWYLFPLHLILIIVFGLVVLLDLDGRTFPTSSAAPYGTTISHVLQGDLRQSDVTTLVSSGLVLVRLSLNACSGIAAQRSIFILLETCGITLPQVERIYTYQQGTLGTSRFKIVTAIMLLLLLPAQVSAPLAQGAVTWEPELSLRPADYNVTLNVAGPGAAFVEFQAHGEPRDFSIRRASGLAVIHRFGADFYSLTDEEAMVPSRRWAPAFREHGLSNHSKGYRPLPGNTSIGDTTLPFFRVANLTWIDYEDSLERFFGDDNGLFNVTSHINPIRASVVGSTVILRDAPMQTWLSSWPNASVLNTTYRLAVLTERIDGQDAAASGCPRSSAAFGSLPGNRQHSTTGPTGLTNCYFFAEAVVVAGTTQCRDCPIILPGVIERPANASSALAIAPDPLVDVVMGMLPETMLSIVTANATYAPTWANLDGFVAGALSVAYQALWNDLTDRLAIINSSSGDSTNVSLPSYPMRAVVDASRVRIWLGLQALVAVSGAMLAMLHARRGRHLPVVDFAAACLLTDASPVLRNGARSGDHVSAADSTRIDRLVVREEPIEAAGMGAPRRRVLRWEKDVGGGGGSGEIRLRRAVAKRQSWSDLSLLRQSTSSTTATLYEVVSSPQPTPQTGSSRWSTSPERAL